MCDPDEAKGDGGSSEEWGAAEGCHGEVRNACRVRPRPSRKFQQAPWEFIRIKSASFTILGWLEAKGSGSFGQDQDDIFLVPYTSVMKRLSGEK